MLSLIYAVFVVLFGYFITQYLSNRSRNRKLRTLPGDPPPYFLGILDLLSSFFAKEQGDGTVDNLLQRDMEMDKKFLKEGVRVLWYGNEAFVSIFSPEILELVLTSNISLEKSFDYSFAHKWVGTGLLTSVGAKWKSRKKLLTPSFHFRILDDFLPSFNEQSRVLVQKLNTLVDKEYVNITDLLVLCTLDIVCETVMGVPIGAQKGENSEYVAAVHNLGETYIKRLTSPWLWSDFTLGLTKIGRDYNRDIDVVHNFTRKVIKEKKALKLAQGNGQETKDTKEGDFQVKKRKALMDLLLDMHLDGQQLTEDGVQEEVDTFMFAGHDTTSMGVTFAMYCIGHYPEIQEKLHEELDSIFADDKERHVTMEDVRDMKYLECVIKESQRLYPSAPSIGRKLNEDIVYKDMIIPKGVTAYMSFISLHRRGDIYPDPEVFDPERFTPENIMKRHNYAFLPFSAGPRNCIGQKFALLEEKVIISTLLRNFTVVSLDPREIELKVELTLKPVKPIRMKFIPRK